jgi:hypothetical protein
MPLSAGSRLGPNEILACLGAGGTGEACRARDTRLSRKVAIRALDHPKICHRYEVCPNCVVMELVFQTGSPKIAFGSVVSMPIADNGPSRARSSRSSPHCLNWRRVVKRR